MDLKQQIREAVQNNTAVDVDFILLEPLVEQLNVLFYQQLQTIAQEIEQELVDSTDDQLLLGHNQGLREALFIINKYIKELGE